MSCLESIVWNREGPRKEVVRYISSCFCVEPFKNGSNVEHMYSQAQRHISVRSIITLGAVCMIDHKPARFLSTSECFVANHGKKHAVQSPSTVVLLLETLCSLQISLSLPADPLFSIRLAAARILCPTWQAFPTNRRMVSVVNMRARDSVLHTMSMARASEWICSSKEQTT